MHNENIAQAMGFIACCDCGGGEEGEVGEEEKKTRVDCSEAGREKVKEVGDSA